MRVTIPDDVADKYAAFAAAQGRTVEEVCTAQLARFAKYEPGKRTVVLGPVHLEAIETMTGGLPVRTGDDIKARVDALAAVTFEHVRLAFTPGQLAEIAHRADRQGRPAAYFIEEACQLILRDFFWATGSPQEAEPAAPPPASPPVPA